ncbi:hypothetical protein D0T50_13670, partial [Bacteroides sp. 214]|nr:hypothetical protein [Bacteroides sp. 214]
KGDAMLLDEVVVVGYGTQKKAHLTGAIATVPMVTPGRITALAPTQTSSSAALPPNVAHISSNICSRVVICRSSGTKFFSSKYMVNSQRDSFTSTTSK